MNHPSGPIAVTGATGFLGGQLVRTLLAQGIPVRALGRRLPEGLALQAAGADFRPVDLRDGPGMRAAFEGTRAVIHAGALSSAWGRYRDFFDSNVLGTENVIAACLAQGVGRLVHISSPSVMSRHAVQRDLDESHPLPETFVSMYSETKALAEARVSAAGAAGLETVILRPKAIYGPGDRALFPRIVAALEKGRLPVIGEGETLTDITHVRDVVQACLLALEAEAATGRIYLITGGEAVNLWDVIGRIAERRGLAPPTRRVSTRKALRIGGVLEALWRLLGLPGEPPLTRYKASVLGYSQTYDISAARRDLGYAPQVPWEDGIEEFLQSLDASSASGPEAPPTGDEASGPVAPPTGVRMTLLKAGHTLARERLLGEGSWKAVRLPASFALLEHPTQGPGLFDTGYSHRFHAATARLPFRIYRWLTPVEVTPAEDAEAQLAARGVAPGDIRWIVLSHLDPDHVGGLRDFPGARIHCSWRAWEEARGRAGWGALTRRILPALFPDDLSGRLHLLPDPGEPPAGPLGPALDLFGDGALRLVSLPGHAAGHLGALVRTTNHGDVLLCGDACWARGSLEGRRRTGVHRLIAADRAAQDATYDRLTALRREMPEVMMIPTHCRAAYDAIGED
jgi:nucleoside-diphosphate-sugar epimerase/glyoxylase-like metal-dependent hydrolase (beta-lactamase superfamily II)